MTERDPAYSVPCPFCEAMPGQACVTIFNRQPRTEPHEIRKMAARR